MDNVQLFPVKSVGEIEETPLPLFPEGKPIVIPPNVEEIASQAAVVESQHTGTNYNEQFKQSIQDLVNLGPDEVRRAIAEKEKAVDIAVSEKHVRESPKETLQDAVAYYEEVLRKYYGPPDRTAMEEAVVDTIVDKGSPAYYSRYNRKEATKNLAARNVLYETLFENAENSTFWEHVLSFGRNIIPFVNSRSVAKSVASALNRETKWGDIVNPDNIVNEFRNTYIKSSPEKRELLVKALVHGLETYSRFFGDINAAQVAENLSRVLASGKVDFIETTSLDALGLPVVGLGNLIYRGINTAVHFGKPALVAKQVGNANLASNILARDAVEGTKMSGLTPDEIARQATSLNISPLETVFPELKIAQTLQDRLREFGAKLREQVGDKLSPTGVSPDEVAKGQELLAEAYSAQRNKSVYEYIPESYENGLFTGTIKWQSPEGLPFRSREAAIAFGEETGKIGKPVDLTSQLDLPEDVQRMISEGGVVEPAGRWIFEEVRRDAIPLDAVGMFSQADISGRNVFNMNIPFFSASKQIVDERGVGMAANAKIRRDLEKAYRESVNGLSGKERALVNRTLAEGDAVSNAHGAKGYVFNSEELSARGLSDRGVESYYKLRMMRDTMWLFRNRQMVEEFRSEGFVELAFDGNEFLGAINRPVKPLAFGSVKSLSSQGKIGKVLDTRNGKMVEMNADFIDAIYAGGGQVVRLYKPEGIGRRQYSHLIIDNNQASLRDIQVALPYRPGEFARVYTDEYFITLGRTLPDEFDRPVPLSETVRTARNAREAAEYVERHNQAMRLIIERGRQVDTATERQITDMIAEGAPAAPEPKYVNDALIRDVEALVGRYTNPEEFIKEVQNRGLKEGDKFDFHYNRETHSYLADTIDEALSSGRLFYSKRGEKLLSVDPARENTLSITDSLGVELANIGRFITSKDIRVTAIERWMNTFGEGVVNKTFNKWVDFDKGELSADLIKKSLIEKGSKLADIDGDELLRFAEQTRKYIRTQLGLRTSAQKLNESRYRKSIEWVEGRGGLVGKPLDWLGHNLRNSNVADFMRRVNFHVTLGMGNIAQLLVQANGMFIASAVHPIHGLSAAKAAIPLRMALMSDNPNVWKTLATVDSLSSLGLKNIDEFVEIVKAVRKSGILDDIKSTALYNVEDGALDLYAGYSKEAFKQTSPFFFNRGEEMARLVSWEVARREWVRSNPGKAWNGEEALKAILIRQREFNLGMQAHNTAAWQRGWAGIPMQFLQYNLKLAVSLMHTSGQFGKQFAKEGWRAFTNFENGNYRGFNPAQGLRLLGAQIVLYGAAGNGLREIANAIWGDEESGMTTEQKMYLSEGLAGGLFYTLSKEFDEYGEGAKLALGKRLGSFEWYAQVWDKIVQDDTDVTDFLLGVTKSTGVKILDRANDLARVFKYSEEVTPDLVLNELSKWPEVIASWSNFVKGYTYMQNEGFVTSKHGSPIARINEKENLAAFLGISSVQVQEYYESVKDEKRFEKDLTELAQHIKQIQIRELSARMEGDLKLANDLERLRWAMMPRDLGHRRIVDRVLRERLWPGDTALDRQRQRFAEELQLEHEKFRVLDK